MYKFLKVVFDVLLALIALVCVSWLLLPCMLILWCTGEHKVWYLQKRVGYRNRMFSIFKFATMLKNSPNMGTGSLTTRNDPRVLPFGRFLRKTKMLNRMTKMGAVNCSTMALAAVVILLAIAKSALVRKINMVPRATHRFIRRG